MRLISKTVSISRWQTNPITMPIQSPARVAGFFVLKFVLSADISRMKGFVDFVRELLYNGWIWLGRKNSLVVK